MNELPLLVLIICMGLGVVTTTPSPTIQYNITLDELTVHSYYASNELTLENVYKELLFQEVRYPEVALAQCMMETGRLSSHAARNYNNLFGMFKAKRRPTTRIQTKTRGNLARFKHWKDSVLDYKYWQKWTTRNYKQIPSTEWGYIQFLRDKGYIGKTDDPNYEKYLLGIIEEINNNCSK